MSKAIDIEIFKHISLEMNVAEIYLGYIPFEFHYTQAEYTATCTEAIPFNPFDKVICELLTIEEQLSFEKIGDILGMNVYRSENPKRYLDLAEKEIWMEALQDLASDDYKMIEGGDIYFSRCRLTPTGKEYAKKKNKFREIENKPFTIYFDHTTGSHINAKEVFEFVNGNISSIDFSIEFADEVVLKQIGLKQIPDIYNPEKQYSFTNAVLQGKKSLVVEYPVAITFNVIEKSFQFYCYDSANTKIHNYFTEWICNNEDTKHRLLTEFSAIQLAASVTTNRILNVIVDTVSKYPPSTKINTVKSDLLKNEFVDEQLFYSAFNELLNSKDKVELYLCLPFVTESIFKCIKEIIQNSENENSRFYFVFPFEEAGPLQDEIDQLIFLSMDTENLLAMQQSEIVFSFCCRQEKASFYFEYIPSSINGFTKNIFQRKVWDESAEKIVSSLLDNFSDQFAAQICNAVDEAINTDMQEMVNKAQLDELDFYEFKLLPFVHKGSQSETVKMALELIDSFRIDRIEKLSEKLGADIDGIESKLAAVVDEKEFLEIKKAFTNIQAEIIFSESEIAIRCEGVAKIIYLKQAEFEEAKKIFSFILDTNIFLKDQNIISKIPSKYKVIVADKVVEELNSFKNIPQLKEISKHCISEIHLNKNKNIHRTKANLKRLPKEFSKKSPDNLILAVAFIYKDLNGILVSDVVELNDKAKQLDIPIMTHDNFIAKFITI